MITPNDSITLVPRQRHKEDRRTVPVLLLVGNMEGRALASTGRVVTFEKSLLLGRRASTNVEPGTSSLVLHDRMVSSRHATIARAGDREALISSHQGVRYTYAEFGDAVRRLAAGMLGAGLGRGDRVGVWAPNRAEWTLVQYATAAIGETSVDATVASICSLASCS